MSCGRSYAGTPKNFHSTHIGYKAHRAVIFAIAHLSCNSAHSANDKRIHVIVVVHVSFNSFETPS